jgi:POT family proton-dependent oligopeptide transporter
VDNAVEKHPKSLRIFCATELWERYGFYAVQSLLALYMAFHFKWPDKQIYSLVGSFTALTYLSPLIGGWIADKLIGQKQGILFGLLSLFISYCTLAVIDNPASLTVSLAGIAVGTGLLKPNISSLLGNEYSRGSKRRLSGFTIFYMGITTGIIIGTTLPSQLTVHVGWGGAFASAAIGIVIGIITFLYGIIVYKIKDYNRFVFQWRKYTIALLIMIAFWAISYFILTYPELANAMFLMVVIFSVAYLVYTVCIEESEQSHYTMVIGLLCIISVVFWAFYFQMFMSLTLFISRVVEPELLGIPFPPPYYITVQSIGMMVIGYFISRKQVQLSVRERGLSTGRKFILSMLIMTLAYLTIVLVTKYINVSGLIVPIYIIPAYLLISWAELLLSPVGLSAITMLACKNKVSTMMGIFFVSLGIGGFLSGKLSEITAAPEGETNLLVLKNLYITGFTYQLCILVAATAVCFILFAIIKFLLNRDQIYVDKKS